jgi:DNA-binding winged helix-turn-helix (wHTH) protein
VVIFKQFAEESMDRANSELPVLIGQAGPLNGQRWLIKDSVMVGRDAECEVVIPDRQISRYHARMTRAEDGVILEDLASKNGTFLGGERISEPALLQDGDLIQIALVQSFVYLSSDATMPLEYTTAGQQSSGGKLHLDIRSRRVWIGQEEVVPPLSAPQFRFLQVLYDRQGQVVPRHELVSEVWGDEDAQGVSEQALDALVRRLRERLATLDPEHPYVITVRGHGLRLDNPAS